MLITCEDEGGFSLDERKSAEQDGRSDTMVEFGSRPAKRARFLSDSNDPVRKAHVSSFERTGLAQDGIWEESNGDVGGKSQADDPMSERNLGVTNGFCIGMKVVAPMHACENVQTRVSTEEDKKRGLLNHGIMNRNAMCTMQQDADDTISTSGDEALFVIQMRSPTSKQLLHGRNWSIDQEELREVNNKTGGPHDNEPICYDVESPVITKLWKIGVQNEAKMSLDYVSRKRQSNVTRKLDAEQTGDIEKSIRTVEFVNAGTSQKAPSIDTMINGPDKKPVSTTLEQTSMVDALGGKHEGGVRNVAPIAENGSTGYIPIDGLKPDGSNQLDLGLIRNAIKDVDTTDTERLEGNIEGDTAPISKQEDVHATINPANEVEAAKAVELVTKSSAKEASAVRVFDKEEPGVNTSEVLNVYVRKKKRNNASEIVTVDSAMEQLKSEVPFCERVIKHYVRRPHRQPGQADVIEKSFQNITTSASNGGKENHKAEYLKDTSAIVETKENLHVFQRRSKKKNQPPEAEHHTKIPAKVEAEGNLNVFQRRSKKTHSPPAEQHVDVFARVETEGNLKVFQRRSKENPPLQAEQHSNVSARIETEGNINVFQRRSKMNLPRKVPSENDIVKEVNDKHSPVGYVRADHQPNWLPKGWTLEIRQGETTACTKDEYYHDNKSGHIFRSKNDVLQFLEGGGMMGMKVSLQNKKRPPISIAPAKHTGFQSPLSKPSQPGLAPPASPGSPFMNMHPARMKTTSVRPTSAISSEANGTDPTWAHLKGPNGAIGTRTGTDERCQRDGSAKNEGVLALHGIVANSSQLLNSGDRIQLPTESSVSTVKSPSDQADEKNKGKLIFRLKRKHPDSEGGKGRSKRPIYEVVHVEKASSSTSTPTKQEKKLATGEKTSQAVPPTLDSVQMHVERVSSVKELNLSPNVVSGSMSVKAQVEKHIPLEKPCPSPVVMPIVEQHPTALKPGLEKPTTMSNNWGIQHNPLQHLELLQQQEPYIALGIPATARSSGLQTYSANHTHVFLDPVTNTIPLSWQYPFAGHASTTTIVTTTSGPTLGPFPSVVTTPSVYGTVSTTIPVPVFEHFPAVSLNATATIVPCSESGVDSRKRDSTSNSAKVAEGGPQVHKAFTTPKSLTKAENTKLLLDLGRRLSGRCRAQQKEPA